MTQIAQFNGAAISKKPGRVEDAAQQFEALLIAQILHSAHEGQGGWLGSSDSSASCATDYAEQQMAAVLAQQGGLGLSKLITAGLNREDAAKK